MMEYRRSSEPLISLPPTPPPPLEITRNDFPSDFLFGAATSAYQVEGAAMKYGRGMCNWDKFAFTMPGKIGGGANASVAIDNYHRVKEDLKMLKRLGFNTYRFSISWSRILPSGKLNNGGVNPEGVKFYHDVIDMVLAEGLVPFVTIFHFDTPLCLEDEYGGFLSSNIVNDLVDFAKICFFEYGDRIKNWITVNEPWTYTVMGYVKGKWPPAVVADQSRDCYTVAHNLLLGHAHVVHLYRKEFESFQGGQIGITNMSWWYEPYDPNNHDDVAAASRALEFMLGWFTEPVVSGDYPAVMKKYVGNRLPEFSGEEKQLLRGSFDFIGLNYYTAYYAKFSPSATPDDQPYYRDQQAEFSDYRFEDGRKIYIGEKYGTATMRCCAKNFRTLILHTKKQYGDPIIYITENGYGLMDNKDKTLKEMLDDEGSRTIFYKEHLQAVKEAMQHGARVKGYIAWSIFDNYEWANGYDLRYGIVYIDYNNDLKRYPKNSAYWFMKFLKNPPKLLDGPENISDDGDNNTLHSNKRRRDR